MHIACSMKLQQSWFVAIQYSRAREPHHLKSPVCTTRLTYHIVRNFTEQFFANRPMGKNLQKLFLRNAMPSCQSLRQRKISWEKILCECCPICNNCENSVLYSSKPRWRCLHSNQRNTISRYSQVGRWVVDIMYTYVSKQNGCNYTHNQAVHTYIG